MTRLSLSKKSHRFVNGVRMPKEQIRIRWSCQRPLHLSGARGQCALLHSFACRWIDEAGLPGGPRRQERRTGKTVGYILTAGW